MTIIVSKVFYMSHGFLGTLYTVASLMSSDGAGEVASLVRCLSLGPQHPVGSWMWCQAPAVLELVMQRQEDEVQ